MERLGKSQKNVELMTQEMFYAKHPDFKLLQTVLKKLGLEEYL